MNMVDNPFSLQGKTILVTGASSGIGRAISIACSRMGAKVVLPAVTKNVLIQYLTVFREMAVRCW